MLRAVHAGRAVPDPIAQDAPGIYVGLTVCVQLNCGMSLPEVDADLLSARLLLIRAHLDERAWRLLMGAEAKVLGRGGIKAVARR